MRLSTKFVYGLQFLMNVAESTSDKYVQLRDVVRKEFVSEKYLESIASQLKQNGLLTVKRGATGGYKLSKKREEISLYEIILALDNTSLMPENAVENRQNATINKQVVTDTVANLENYIRKYLKNISLNDIIKDKANYINYNDYQI
ncbi:MAG: Rrf2 family transcriptional regulator [Bacteroidales bacterium]|nr:Rrf2 family transcriptional regulator [Bacteroidales bacterium]